jgi:nitric oxide reductase large subunit
MVDQSANQIVFFLLLVILIGIVLSAYVLLQGVIGSKLKNSAGNLSSVNILMMFGVFVGIFFLIRFFFKESRTLTQVRK